MMNKILNFILIISMLSSICFVDVHVMDKEQFSKSKAVLAGQLFFFSEALSSVAYAMVDNITNKNSFPAPLRQNKRQKNENSDTSNSLYLNAPSGYNYAGFSQSFLSPAQNTDIFPLIICMLSAFLMQSYAIFLFLLFLLLFFLLPRGAIDNITLLKLNNSSI